MDTALHIKTKVLPGHRIEVQVDDLHIGDSVDVFVVISQKASSQGSILDRIKAIRGKQTCFRSAEEIDQYIREERASWD